MSVVCSPTSPAGARSSSIFWPMSLVASLVKVVVVADEERKLIGVERRPAGDQRKQHAAAPHSSSVPAIADFEVLLVVAELAIGEDGDLDAPGAKSFQGFLELDGGDVAGMNFVGGMGEPHLDRLRRGRHAAWQVSRRPRLWTR